MRTFALGVASIQMGTRRVNPLLWVNER